ncbi:MAG: hypothetical protein ACPGVA_02680 [Pikeienuella sp.]
MQRATTNPAPSTHATPRKWRPIMMDQLTSQEGHPGDHATGLLEWLALWQAPKGGLL